MLRNGIPRVCFYFCSTERNSKLFSLPRNSSERNSESLLLLLLLGTEFRAFFSSTEWFRMEFREFVSILFNRIEHFSIPRNGSERKTESFLFCGTAKIPPEQNICSVYFVFRRIIFCRKFLSLWRPCS